MPDRNATEGATRVGHAERLATIDELSKALAHGRLEMDEADERIAAATQAKTYADLRVLTTDLPPPVAKGSGGLDQHTLDLARRTVATIRSSRVAQVALLVAFLGLLTMGISGLFDGDHEEEARDMERAVEEGPDSFLIWPTIAAAVALVVAVLFIVGRNRARRATPG